MATAKKAQLKAAVETEAEPDMGQVAELPEEIEASQDVDDVDDTEDPAGVDPDEAGQPEVSDAMCIVHFPLGWGSSTILRTEAVTGVRQPSVTCEHGTYARPIV